jgi:hypothetical protein
VGACRPDVNLSIASALVGGLLALGILGFGLMRKRSLVIFVSLLSLFYGVVGAGLPFFALAGWLVLRFRRLQKYGTAVTSEIRKTVGERSSAKQRVPRHRGDTRTQGPRSLQALHPEAAKPSKRK